MSPQSWFSARRGGGYLIFFLFLAAAAVLRFYRITEVGLSGHDTFQYVDWAKRIIDGEPYLRYYRPVVYITNAAFMLAFGYKDYAYFLPLALFTTLSVVLTFLIGQKLFKNDWLAFCAASIFAFLPQVGRIVSKGYVHGHSTIYVLLSFFFFISFYERWEKSEEPKFAAFLLLLAGAALGLAGHTHEELPVIGAAFALMFFVQALKQNRVMGRPFWHCTWVVHLLIYTLGFLLPYLVSFWAIGFEQVLNNMLQVQGSKFARSEWMTFPTHAVALFDGFFIGGLGKALGTMFIISLVWAGVTLKKGYNSASSVLISPGVVLCALIPLFYWAAYISLLGTRQLTRLFSPFVPLCAIFAVAGLAALLQVLAPKRYLLFAVIISLLFVTSLRPWKQLREGTSANRQIYNLLEDKVSSEARLLLPVGFHGKGRIRKGHEGYDLKSAVYFGQNAVALYMHRDGPTFEEIVSQNNIRYVLVPKHPNTSPNITFKLETYFDSVFNVDLKQLIVDHLSFLLPQDLRRGEFTVRKLLEKRLVSYKTLWAIERKFCLQELEQLGATKLLEVPKLADIYEIPAELPTAASIEIQ